MAKKEQEMYEGMPVIEASDAKALEKKLAKISIYIVYNYQI